MKKCSIVVPVYNSELYLNRCLDSIARQTLENIEALLIYDKGCSDDSLSIVDRYVQVRPELFARIDVEHCMLGEARNKGFERAQGAFVAFVDSDDYVEDSFCEKAVRRAEETGADIVCFATRKIFGESGKSEVIAPRVDERMGPRLRMLSATVMAWDKLYRMEFAKRVGLRYPPLFHEDVAETSRLFACDPVVSAVAEPLYNYIKRADSLSGLALNPRDLDQIKVALTLKDYSRQYPTYAAEFEYLAQKELRDFRKAAAEVDEEWARQGVRDASAALASLGPYLADNPYCRLDAEREPSLAEAIRRLRWAMRESIMSRIRLHKHLYRVVRKLKRGLR